MTALAAVAVQMLAEREGITPAEALTQVVERGYGGLFRAPQAAKRAHQPDD